ncbi:MAG: hypothetical protein MRZ79_07305 [Bacteroidia bacterium]|nr:hypothetical protein [Bacteroidia bacterium]
MEPQSLTPKESLDLIKEVILDAKHRQEENGIIYMYWGITVALVGIAHYVLYLTETYSLIFIPYLLFPVAALISYFIFPHYKKETPKNQIGTIIGGIWIFAAVNMMILGFALSSKLQDNLMPFIIILQSMAIGGTGLASSSRTLLIAGIGANVAGVLGFWLAPQFHPLLMTGVSIFALLLPGILLNNAYRKRKHV